MILDRYPMLKGLILDMDGVIWRDDQAIGNLPEIFNSIKNLGLSFVFATNNSTKTVEEYKDKLKVLGLAVESDQILTSAVATFLYLEENYPEKKTIYIIGSDSFKADAIKRGFTVIAENNQCKADFVIVGLDRAFDYQKINTAARLIFDGAKFLATNCDPTYPTPQGPIPGAGVMVASVKTASGVEPIVIGKPSPIMYETAMKVMRLGPKEILCVGDRLETDILGAHKGGFHSALVLSGVTSMETLSNWEPKPEVVANDLWTLINA
jgi:4-nitrophenyl phosphatase